MRPPNCDNFLEILEEDGYCTSCGKNHWQYQRAVKKSRKVAQDPKPEKAAEEIRAQIMSNPVYRTAIETAELLLETFDINDVRVIFRNRKGSSFEVDRWGRKTIIFGYENIDWFAKDGFQEYATVQYVLPEGKILGKEAAKWVAMHEVAHAVDYQRNGHIRGVSHGRGFHRAYNEIINLIN